MPYEFQRTFATVQDGVRHIATELLDDAISSAGRKGMDIDTKIHSARKTCKKLRGLIRLVRPVFDQYRDENTAFRDAGRELSGLRDGDVLIETYDLLLKAYEDQVERTRFAPIRRQLTITQKERLTQSDIPKLLKKFCHSLSKARKRATGWRISEDGFDALEGGVKKAYKGARRAMSVVASDPTPEAVHEWRKRVKDHWYHTRLVCPIWPKPIKVHSDIADQLGDMLGRHHDLEVFRQQLATRDLGSATDVEVLAGLVRRRQKVLEAEAMSIGIRLFAEPVLGLTRRWRSYWDAWREKAYPLAV